MKKLVAGALTALFLSGAGAVAAAPGDNGKAGPNDHNLFGLCTAYAANENGREHGRAEEAPPFKALASDATDAGFDTVQEYCDDVAPEPGTSYPED